jgi:hypothetical protein
MQEHELYRGFLGIAAPVHVDRVELKLKEDEVRVLRRE